MASPFNKVRSKLNRAIAAYLVSQGVGSPSNGSPEIVPANYHEPKSLPNITVQSQISRPESALTGLRRVTVHIRIKGSAVQNPNEPNLGQARLDFDALVATCYDTLMQSSDGTSLRFMAGAITAAGRALATPFDNSAGAAQLAANNADMVDFTCEGWYDMGEGDGEPSEEGTYWEEILIFEALASGSNTD